MYDLIFSIYLLIDIKTLPYSSTIMYFSSVRLCQHKYKLNHTHPHTHCNCFYDGWYEIQSQKHSHTCASENLNMKTNEKSKNEHKQNLIFPLQFVLKIKIIRIWTQYLIIHGNRTKNEQKNQLKMTTPLPLK